MKEKILIIEDDPLIRNELKTLLQSNSALQQRFQFIPY